MIEGDSDWVMLESLRVSEKPTSERDAVTIAAPELADGGALWRIARDSGKLDLNSSYFYLLWCRDFAATSVVARADGEVVGFVVGYLRPDAPDTFVVWQVAVQPGRRGDGIAGRMLHRLADRLAPRGARFLEATVTPDNQPSTRLFSAFALDRGADIRRDVLFDANVFPDDHESEVLLRIGPFGEHRRCGQTHDRAAEG